MNKTIIDENKLSVLDMNELEKIMLDLKLARSDRRKILVASTAKGEGKTSIALALSMLMARSGSKVLYVSSEYPAFFVEIPQEAGIYSSDVDNLDVLLGGSSLSVEEQSGIYDYIFADAKALLDSNEGIVYSEKCDLIFLVIEANRVDYKKLRESREKLLIGGCKDLLIILNKTQKTYGTMRRKVL